ncbi:Glyoxylate reductase / Hydroxypyruvate reductase [Halanaerobium saccharolyticum subsp. saccharolyticum DSM 6643]|uniref:Glyoxylate reductase / Hydroxypyruvate reductase n=1 Tax=Halanaerobium saccharolyticum subsp. saccharolyticum DSM 6643 TaxID=1293054 RepID=M5E1P3_9FIRM|nr:D-glycerate dehydrogenase [Halanaerobium saccharolyticum]CCU79837.1 Glyoxylate reductase / Hydroxypyruvate reductase [Halanaerobium saccharolyticum subsp. saccharolyticum DSM 6643]
MSKDKRVYVTRKLPKKALEMLEREFKVEVNPHDRVMTREELETAVKDIDGLLCLLTDSIDSELLELNPDLKVIANYAVGYNNIDVEACTKKEIKVSNTPGVLTDTTADFAWTLLMAAARRIIEADKFTRAGKYKGWGPMMFLGGDIYGKKLGIIGIGRIGRAFARRAKGFDMDFYYYDVNRLEKAEEKRLGLEYKNFEDLLKESDFISLHVPLIPQTRHLIGEEELKLMKETAYLINTARGPIIDEKALVWALKNGEIAGAGLDVYEEEPNLYSDLDKLDNTVLTPHIASASIETRTKMATMAAENLIAGLKGKEMPNLINKEAVS